MLAETVELRAINCHMTSLVRAWLAFQMKSHQSDICRFRATILSPLNLVANWPVFTIYNIYSFKNVTTKSVILLSSVIWASLTQRGTRTWQHIEQHAHWFQVMIDESTNINTVATSIKSDQNKILQRLINAYITKVINTCKRCRF